jgi:hypothetical protein
MEILCRREGKGERERKIGMDVIMHRWHTNIKINIYGSSRMHIARYHIAIVLGEFFVYSGKHLQSNLSLSACRVSSLLPLSSLRATLNGGKPLKGSKYLNVRRFFL